MFFLITPQGQIKFFEFEMFSNIKAQFITLKNKDLFNTLRLNKHMLK